LFLLKGLMMKKIVQLTFIITVATVMITYSYENEQFKLEDKLKKIEEKIRITEEHCKGLNILKDKRENLIEEIKKIGVDRLVEKVEVKDPNEWPAEKHKEYKLWFLSEYSKMTPENQRTAEEFVNFYVFVCNRAIFY